jgi:hypothetical protein
MPMTPKSSVAKADSKPRTKPHTKPHNLDDEDI